MRIAAGIVLNFAEVFRLLDLFTRCRPVAKKAASEVNKSELIRNYKAEHPEAGPTAIVEALGQQGVKVTAAFVSTVLSNAKRKARRRGGRRAGVARAAGNGVATLVQAKQFADKLGGIEKARAALDALAKILS